jgi:NAD(P)-dependent dehydrogenase (short-subunit alcohol dehydrogenase family)
MQRRVCLLTGAAGVLGQEFCRLHAANYDIVAVHRTSLPGVDCEEQRFIDPLNPPAPSEDYSPAVYPIRADLGDDRDLERIMELTLARFGGVDLMVNSAVYSVWSGMDSDRLTASFDQQFRINVRAPFMLAGLFARHYWRTRDRENRQRKRNVIHISSLAGVKVFRGMGQSVYAASKAALNHLTLHMADEYRSFGVRVNAIAPNSFPQIVSVKSVVAAVRRVDQGDTTGKILIVDAPKPHAHP